MNTKTAALVAAAVAAMAAAALALKAGPCVTRTKASVTCQRTALLTNGQTFAWTPGLGVVFPSSTSNGDCEKAACP